MLNPKNNAAILRLAVLTNVAKSFLENNLSDIENLISSFISFIVDAFSSTFCIYFCSIFINVMSGYNHLAFL